MIHMKTSITIDKARFDELTAELKDMPGTIDRAGASAVAKTLKFGRTRLVRQFAETTTPKQKQIRQRITLRNVKPLSGEIVINDRPFALSAFKLTRGTKKTPIAAEMIRGERVAIPGAFRGVGFFGQHVLQRTAGKLRLSRAHYPGNVGRLRQRVASVKGLSLIDLLLRRPQIEGDAIQDIGAKFEENLLSQVDRFLQRRKIDRPETTTNQ
jgi:hypothetical protein